MNNDFIVRVSRKREDARRVKDHRALFSSDAPSITPLHVGLVRAGTVTGTTILQHNLGYKPLFLLWQKGVKFRNPPPTFAVGPYSMPVNSNDVDFRINKEKFYIQPNEFSDNPTEIDYNYAIFDIDLDKEYEAPILTAGDREGAHVSSDDFSFKVTDRRTVRANDSSEFTVNSDTQPLFLHSVIKHNGEATSDGTIRIEHNLGYPPAFFVHGRNRPDQTDDSFRLYEFAPESSLSATASADDRFLSLTNISSFVFSATIFKDPIL